VKRHVQPALLIASVAFLLLALTARVFVAYHADPNVGINELVLLKRPAWDAPLGKDRSHDAWLSLAAGNENYVAGENFYYWLVEIGWLCFLFSALASGTILRTGQARSDGVKRLLAGGLALAVPLALGSSLLKTFTAAVYRGDGSPELALGVFRDLDNREFLSVGGSHDWPVLASAGSFAWWKDAYLRLLDQVWTLFPFAACTLALLWWTLPGRGSQPTPSSSH
jgi:hypothetical protein